jgi:hypothetical protein
MSLPTFILLHLFLSLFDDGLKVILVLRTRLDQRIADFRSKLNISNVICVSEEYRKSWLQHKTECG